MSIMALTKEEEKELYRLQNFYWKEAIRCEKSEAYLAGCIMLGSWLETMLILMVNCFPEEAEQTSRAPNNINKQKSLLRWDFTDLLSVAKGANWLPSSLNLDDGGNTRKALIGDYAEVVRMVRNLAHPGSYTREHFRKRVTKKYLERQFEVVLLCRDWLLKHNNESLLNHMKEEGLIDDKNEMLSSP